MADQFDVVVIGGGPGGYAAALLAGSAGLHVALVEADTVGGTCLNRGCIPAKELLQTADVLRTVRESSEYGIMTSAPTIDWPAAIKRQGMVVNRLVTGLGGLLKKRKVEVVNGFGRLTSPTTVDVDGRTLTADAIILATGSTPTAIPNFAFDGTKIVSSDHALFLNELPKSVAIVGGGVIGCEFTSVFVDCGVSVLLLEALPSLLAGADPDLGKFLQTELSKRGATIKTGAKVTGQRPAEADDRTTVMFEHNGEALEADVDLVLVAVGRRPNTADIGLDAVGVATNERGFVVVDEAMRTSVPGVYAVGDIVPTPALAHVGYAEAGVAVRDILGEDPHPVDYPKVPWCVYTHPEIAWCGLTEAQAKEAGHNVKVHKGSYAGVGRAIILGETKGFVKIVADADTEQILGFHLAGPWATEQLTEGYLATNWEATYRDLGHLVHAHPTLSEAIGEAAEAMTGRAIHG